MVCMVLLGSVSGLAAQERNFTYKVKAGFNIGGTSPLPIPAQIREIKSYNPLLGLSLGAEATYHFNERWGIMSGLKFENKGMSTHARVKSYKMSMDITDGGTTGKVNGYFTGDVKTKVRNDYLTIPVAVVWRISPRWEVNGGIFTSILLNGGFTGEAFDAGGTGEAYIRDTDPTGEKIGVTSATYDLSKDVRNFNFGLLLGGSWNAYRQLWVYGDFTMAANSIFPKNFGSIPFRMYNVYLNLGLAFAF